MSARHARVLSISAAMLLLASPALAQKKYDPGASDTEIKLGNIVPYSGPASAYGAVGRAQPVALLARRLAGDPLALAGRRRDAPVQRRRQLQGDLGPHQPLSGSLAGSSSPSSPRNFAKSPVARKSL